MHAKTLTLALLFVLIGCSNRAILDKGDVRGSKGDDTGDLCLDIGEPADCDLCEVLDWYGDGFCDDFCAMPDPDCAPAFCDEANSEHEACVAEKPVGLCLPAEESPERLELEACCTDINDERALCMDLAHAENCDLEGDFADCVFDAMAERDLSEEEAQNACAQEISDFADQCCGDFPGSFSCQILTHLED